MITIHEWTRSVALGSEAVVSFDMGAPARPLVELRLDAIGDGLSGATVRGDDLRAVRALALPMLKVGTFSLHVWAVDADGCQDETAMSRPIVVSL